jgi:hypothetical protein
MNWNDVLDDIISGLQPQNVPVEFIVMAKLTDRTGVEQVLRGDDLVTFMANPEKANAKGAKIVLDVRKIRRSMSNEIVRFFENLAAKIPG